MKPGRKLCKNDCSLLSFKLFTSSCSSIIALLRCQAKNNLLCCKRGYKVLVKVATLVFEDSKKTSSLMFLQLLGQETLSHTQMSQQGIYVLPTQQSRSLKEKGVVLFLCVYNTDCCFSLFLPHSTSSDQVTLAQARHVSASVCECA